MEAITEAVTTVEAITEAVDLTAVADPDRVVALVVPDRAALAVETGAASAAVSVTPLPPTPKETS